MKTAYRFSAKEVSAILAAHTGKLTPKDVFSYTIEVKPGVSETDESWLTLTIEVTGRLS